MRFFKGLFKKEKIDDVLEIINTGIIVERFNIENLAIKNNNELNNYKMLNNLLESDFVLMFKKNNDYLFFSNQNKLEIILEKENGEKDIFSKKDNIFHDIVTEIIILASKNEKIRKWLKNSKLMI